jgi:Sec-independent protein secretion pathway component TatC
MKHALKSVLFLKILALAIFITSFIFSDQLSGIISWTASIHNIKLQIYTLTDGLNFHLKSAFFFTLLLLYPFGSLYLYIRYKAHTSHDNKSVLNYFIIANILYFSGITAWLWYFFYYIIEELSNDPFQSGEQIILYAHSYINKILFAAFVGFVLQIPLALQIIKKIRNSLKPYEG